MTRCSGVIWPRRPSKRAQCKYEAGPSGFCEMHDPELEAHRKKVARGCVETRRFYAEIGYHKPGYSERLAKEIDEMCRRNGWTDG